MSKVTQKHFRQPSSIKSTVAPCRGLFRPTDGRLFHPFYFRSHSFSNSRQYIFYRIFVPSGKLYQCPHFCRSQFHLSENLIECGNPPGFAFVKIFVHIPGSPFWLNDHLTTPFSLSAIHRSVARSCLLSSMQTTSGSYPSFHVCPNIPVWLFPVLPR